MHTQIDTRVCGLVLCGGKSRRMGAAKTALELDGQTLEQRAWDTLALVCDQVFISAAFGVSSGPETIADLHPELGPLGGLLSAQAHCADAAWLILAVDMPAVTANTLKPLLAARKPGMDAVVFESSAGFEPVCALYEASSAPVVLQQWRNRQFSLQQLLARLTVQSLQAPAAELININTPEQWQSYQSGGGPQTA